jgi:hypothetical protein
MKKIFFITIFISMFEVSTVDADNGIKFLDMCNSALAFDVEKAEPLDAMKLGSCFSYLEGFSHGLKLASRIADEPFLCMPEEHVTNRQWARIVISYLEKNPKKLHESKFILVLEAMLDAFPCSKSDPNDSSMKEK